MKQLTVLARAFVVAGVFASSALAQDSAEVLARMKAMEDRIQALEMEIQALKGQSAGAPAATGPAVAQAPQAAAFVPQAGPQTSVLGGAGGAASKVLNGPAKPAPVADRKAFIESVRCALYCSKMISYAQGYMLLREAAREQKSFGRRSRPPSESFQTSIVIRPFNLSSLPGNSLAIHLGQN